MKRISLVTKVLAGLYGVDGAISILMSASSLLYFMQHSPSITSPRNALFWPIVILPVGLVKLTSCVLIFCRNHIGRTLAIVAASFALLLEGFTMLKAALSQTVISRGTLCFAIFDLLCLIWFATHGSEFTKEQKAAQPPADAAVGGGQ